MEYKNVIAIDAMGGDNAPAEIIKGAIEAINERADIKLHLFGDKDKIETEPIPYICGLGARFRCECIKRAFKLQRLMSQI